jgi:hypothetical protein
VTIIDKGMWVRNKTLRGKTGRIMASLPTNLEEPISEEGTH